MLTRDAILSQMQRRITTEHSDVFGGDLRLRELSRAEYRAAERDATTQQRSADGRVLVDGPRWNAGVFAAGVIDADGAPLFTPDEVLAWPERTPVWLEVLRVATLILELSEVGPEALKAPSTD